MKEVYRFVVLRSETLRAGTDLTWRKWKFCYILISSPRCISCCFKIFTIATSRSMSSWLVGRIQPIIIYICQFGRVRKIACLLALFPSFSSRDSCLPRTQTFVERHARTSGLSRASQPKFQEAHEITTVVTARAYKRVRAHSPRPHHLLPFQMRATHAG